ncbi:MAG: hypothetical protein V3U19_07555 [Thermodesulfobacteriota bacterium]
MNKKCYLLGVLFFLVFFISGVSANSSGVSSNSTFVVLDGYIAEFNAIAEGYATGEISAEETICRWSKVYFYFRKRLGRYYLSEEESALIQGLMNEKYEDWITEDVLSEALRTLEPPTESVPTTLEPGSEVQPPTLEPPELTPSTESVPTTLEPWSEVQPPSTEPPVLKPPLIPSHISGKISPENPYFSHVLWTIRNNLERDETIVTYFSLNLKRPIVIALTAPEGGSFAIQIQPDISLINQGTRSYDGPEGAEEEERLLLEAEKIHIQCTNEAAMPEAEKKIDSARSTIAKATAINADTTNSEKRLEEAVRQFKNGESLEAIFQSNMVERIAEAEWELKKLETMSKEERRTHVLEKIGKDIQKGSGRKGVEVHKMDEDEFRMSKKIGMKRLGLTYSLDGDPFYSMSQVIDIDKKTSTTYENRLFESYDLSIDVDVLFFYKMLLLGEKEASPFEYGIHIGKGILQGDVKIKPIWRFYKIFDLLNAFSGPEGTEVSKGVMETAS